MSAAMNPRVLREQFGSFAGKKVMLGLTNLHYVCCQVVAVGPQELDVTVNGKSMKVPTDLIDTIHETYESAAEYVK